MAEPSDPAAAPRESASPTLEVWGAFPSGMGFAFDLDDDGRTMAGEATITDLLQPPSARLPRVAVLATITDCVAGIPAHVLTAPRLAVTLDIAVRLVAESCGSRLVIKGEIVKSGLSTVAGEVSYFDAETSAMVAHTYATFMVSPRPQDRAPRISRGMRTQGNMDLPLPEYVGARVLEPGVAEVERTPNLRQAAGSLQGGIVALIGEMAAESLVGAPVRDLDVRYLSAVRVGPGRATATDLGGGQVRVEVRDRGRDDRLTALIAARLAP